jgi:nitric oxide dioxygenase
MSVSDRQRALVRRSFPQVATYHSRVSRLFYDKLFEIAPEVRDLFTIDMAVQGDKLMQMLAMLVSSLDDSAQLIEASASLGQRHVGYGVTHDQYKLVGQALMWALEESLPLVMTAPVLDAWQAAYQAIADAAIKGSS